MNSQSPKSSNKFPNSLPSTRNLSNYNSNLITTSNSDSFLIQKQSTNKPLNSSPSKRRIRIKPFILRSTSPNAISSTTTKRGGSAPRELIPIDLNNCKKIRNNSFDGLDPVVPLSYKLVKGGKPSVLGIENIPLVIPGGSSNNNSAGTSKLESKVTGSSVGVLGGGGGRNSNSIQATNSTVSKLKLSTTDSSSSLFGIIGGIDGDDGGLVKKPKKRSYREERKRKEGLSDLSSQEASERNKELEKERERERELELENLKLLVGQNLVENVEIGNNESKRWLGTFGVGRSNNLKGKGKDKLIDSPTKKTRFGDVVTNRINSPSTSPIKSKSSSSSHFTSIRPLPSSSSNLFNLSNTTSTPSSTTITSIRTPSKSPSGTSSQQNQNQNQNQFRKNKLRPSSSAASLTTPGENQRGTGVKFNSFRENDNNGYIGSRRRENGLVGRRPASSQELRRVANAGEGEGEDGYSSLQQLLELSGFKDVRVITPIIPRTLTRTTSSSSNLPLQSLLPLSISISSPTTSDQVPSSFSLENEVSKLSIPNNTLNNSNGSNGNSLESTSQTSTIIGSAPNSLKPKSSILSIRNLLNLFQAPITTSTTLPSQPNTTSSNPQPEEEGEERDQSETTSLKSTEDELTVKEAEAEVKERKSRAVEWRDNVERESRLNGNGNGGTGFTSKSPPIARGIFQYPPAPPSPPLASIETSAQSPPSPSNSNSNSLPLPLALPINSYPLTPLDSPSTPPSPSASSSPALTTAAEFQSQNLKKLPTSRSSNNVILDLDVGIIPFGRRPRKGLISKPSGGRLRKSKSRIGFGGEGVGFGEFEFGGSGIGRESSSLSVRGLSAVGGGRGKGGIPTTRVLGSTVITTSESESTSTSPATSTTTGKGATPARRNLRHALSSPSFSSTSFSLTPTTITATATITPKTPVKSKSPKSITPKSNRKIPELTYQSFEFDNFNSNFNFESELESPNSTTARYTQSITSVNSTTSNLIPLEPHLDETEGEREERREYDDQSDDDSPAPSSTTRAGGALGWRSTFSLSNLRTKASSAVLGLVFGSDSTPLAPPPVPELPASYLAELERVERSREAEAKGMEGKERGAGGADHPILIKKASKGSLVLRPVLTVGNNEGMGMEWEEEWGVVC